jgi:MFS family permease
MRESFWRWRHGGPVRRGLFWAMLEGGVVSGMFVCLETWMVPLVQDRLLAAAYVIGLLTLIPQAGSILLAPFAGRLIRRFGGNRRVTLLLCWVQILLLGLLSLPLHAAGSAWAVPVAVGLIGLFGLTGVVAGPAWIGWVSGFVPRSISGRYQARRAALFNITKLGFAALFAAIAEFLPPSRSAWGLQIIIAVAVASRILSTWWMSRQPVIERHLPKQAVSSRSAEAASGLGGFLRQLTSSDVGRWTLVWASFMGGVMVAGPFFASYMIARPEHGGLGLEPTAYTILIYTSVLTRIAFFPLAGRLIDTFGPRAVLRLALTGIILLPLPWALTPTLTILIATEVLAGLVWACAEIAIGTLLFSSHPDPERRTELVGYFNTVCASCIALGTLIGTVLVELLPPVLGSSYHTLFLLSAALRIPGLVLAWRWLPGLRPIAPHERADLVEALPGVQMVSSFGRGLAGLFRRPLD